MPQSSPTDIELMELRRMANVLAHHGYDEQEADRMIWRGYQGGMDGARAVFRSLDEIPTIGDSDIPFGEQDG